MVKELLVSFKDNLKSKTTVHVSIQLYVTMNKNTLIQSDHVDTMTYDTDGKQST